jgi:hypothetical protein
LVPQYEQVAWPLWDKSKKTLGWEDHKGIAGLGQCTGKSCKSTSTMALFFMGFFLMRMKQSKNSELNFLVANEKHSHSTG